MKRFWWYVLAFLLMDQGAKVWIRSHLEVGDSLVIWDNVLSFTRYENSGVAFGLLEGYGRLFVPAALIVIGIVLYYRKQGLLCKGIGELGASLLIGGGLGNAIDRVLFNQVTDFISFTSRNGILNLADYAINAGVLLIFIDLLIIERLRKKRETSAADEAVANIKSDS